MQPDEAPGRWRAAQPYALLFAAIGAVVLLLVLYFFRMLILSVLIGLGLGVLLVPVIRLLYREARVPKALGALIVVVLLLGGMGGVGYLVYSLVADQVGQLVERAPAIGEKLREQLSVLADRFPWLESLLGDAKLDGAFPASFGLLMRGVQGGAAVVTGVIIVLVLGVYVAINAGSYQRGFLSLFPARRRARVDALCRGSARVLRRWFVSQLAVASISGVLTAVALRAIGTEYWLLIGLLTVVLDFIPFIGALLTGAAAGAVTLGTQPEKFWWVIGLFVLIQQIEANVTLPLVMRRGVQLPEAHLLVFMLIFGASFGLIGAFVAPPIFAVLHHLYLEVYVPRMDAKKTAAAEAKSELAVPERPVGSVR